MTPIGRPPDAAVSSQPMDFSFAMLEPSTDSNSNLFPFILLNYECSFHTLLAVLLNAAIELV